MNEIIAGSLSSDLMDYLPRDSLFTGAEYGRIDYNRIINSFTITDGRSIALQRSSLYSFESMLISRYEMFKAVYFHKTVRAAEVMLLHSILLAFDSIDFLTRNVQTFLALTDDTIIAKLLSARQRPVVRQLVRNYLDRKLLKCVYEKFVYKRDKFKELDWKWVEDVRSRIAEIASVDSNHVFVDVSGIASVPLAPNKSEMRSILLMTEKGVIRMPVSSLPIINSISGHLDMLRVYTNHRNRNEIAYAARKIFGDEGLEITDGF
jgi:HD superfamily phosphohydrolase